MLMISQMLISRLFSSSDSHWAECCGSSSGQAQFCIKKSNTQIRSYVHSRDASCWSYHKK